jgi:hypothetical protein
MWNCTLRRKRAENEDSEHGSRLCSAVIASCAWKIVQPVLMCEQNRFPALALYDLREHVHVIIRPPESLCTAFFSAVSPSLPLRSLARSLPSV